MNYQTDSMYYFCWGNLFSSVSFGLSFKFYAKSSDNLIAHLTLHLNVGSFYFPKKCANFFLHVGSFIITLTPIRTRSNWNKPHYLIALEGLEMNVWSSIGAALKRHPASAWCLFNWSPSFSTIIRKFKMNSIWDTETGLYTVSNIFK